MLTIASKEEMNCSRWRVRRGKLWGLIGVMFAQGAFIVAVLQLLS